MKKTPSLFKRDYDGNRQVYNEVVPGSEWVLNGEGVPTIKYDGTACMVIGDNLYKRYDRKHKRKAPPGWKAAEPEPDAVTGHWPGWLPVGDGPEDKWHREAWCLYLGTERFIDDGATFELIGPKVQGNPYGQKQHKLQAHAAARLDFIARFGADDPRTFEAIRDWLTRYAIEGIVWHHPDGRMVKIKRRDFGLKWPAN